MTPRGRQPDTANVIRPSWPTVASFRRRPAEERNRSARAVPDSATGGRCARRRSARRGADRRAHSAARHRRFPGRVLPRYVVRGARRRFQRGALSWMVIVLSAALSWPALSLAGAERSLRLWREAGLLRPPRSPSWAPAHPHWPRRPGAQATIRATRSSGVRMPAIDRHDLDGMAGLEGAARS